MSYVVTGFIFATLGILFGLFPSLCFSFVDTVSQAVMVEHKKVPSWMFIVAGGNTRTHKWEMGFYTEKSAHIVTWSISTLWVIGCLVFSHFLAVANAGGDAVKVIIIEIVFPIFVVLTWLLPIYFLKKYLRRLKSDDSVTDKQDLTKH